MCTAITYQGQALYFGRNLDLEYGYHETITVTPRNYSFHFRNGEVLRSHYAMIGMATVAQSYPLYYEATNEKGLSIAGLNFPGNAAYLPYDERKRNIASFELIPYLLANCSTVAQVRGLLDDANIWEKPFSKEYPPSPLHWIAAGRHEAITIEPMHGGVKIFNNPIGVLTNNPPFDHHMINLANYMQLTADVPKNTFAKHLQLQPYSLGMGAMGLPGDPSSASRFVRAAFTKLNSISDDTDESCITQFFHILGAVEQQRGVTHVKNNAYEITRYTSCCNTDTGIYYYTTYENRQINAVNMYKENLDSNALITYPLLTQQNIHWQNERKTRPH